MVSDTWEAAEKHLGVEPCLVTLGGSHAYGTDRPESDMDYRGVYVAYPQDMVKLQPPPETIDREEPDVVVHELRKFCKLAAASNPNVLETFVAPVVWADEIGTSLRAGRHLFLSRRAYYTYGGYAKQQLEKAKRGSGGSRGVKHFKREKFILHLFRLFEQGIGLLATGDLTVRVADPEALWAKAELDLADVEREFRVLDRRMVEAAADSPLPVEPNWEAIDALMISLRGMD